MYKYPKIETVYKRDMEGTKKLIKGEFQNDTIKMLSEFPIWDCYEKLDGSNFQIFWDGYKITLIGRQEESDTPKHIQTYFDEKFSNNETEELLEQTFHNKPMVFYFEAIGKKIQTYGARYGDVRFVLLDVYNVNNNSWWSYDGIKELARALNVEYKPLLLENVTLDGAIEFVKDTRFSEIAKSPLPMEGLVCIPHQELKDSNGDRIIVKIKGKDFCPDWKQLMKEYKNENS